MCGASVWSASAGIAAVGDGPVADGDDPHGVAAGELVDHAVAPDPKRSEPPKRSPELMSCLVVPFEESEGIVDGVYERPVDGHEIVARRPGEDDASQGSATMPADLPTELGEGHGVALLQVCEPRVDSGESVSIGEDLGGLLEGVVLVDRDEDRGRAAVPSDDDVLTPVDDLVEQLGEGGAQISYTDGLGHKA